MLHNIFIQGSKRMFRNGQPSLQQSRVSSSSSNRSQNYELIPRQQPFLPPTRDLASPKASYPFRKVQAGIESSLAHKMHNESRSSIKGSARDANQSKDLIDVIGQLGTSRKKQENQQGESKQPNDHAECYQKMESLRKKIEQLQVNLEQQRNQYELERKANEIYTEGFSRIREIILSKISDFQGESIQQMVERLSELINAKPNGYENQDVEALQRKIRDLRAELLKSTQNNINAIFNTEITQANCLQHQVQKMNAEIAALKEKLIKVTVESQENINRIMQNKSTSEIKKIIKIYQQKIDSDSDAEDIARQDKKGRKKSAKNRLKESRESSSSDKSARKKRMASTSSHVTELIQGFKYLQGEYAKLDGTIRQINGSQSDFKELFAVLKRDITVSIETQIKEVKQTVKRPSSNTEQLKIARGIQAKLSDLMNTLNAPQKVNLEKSHEEDETVSWNNVESVRKIADLQSRNRRLQDQVRMLSEQRNRLQQNITNLSKLYHSKHKEYHQLCVDSVEERIKRSSKKGELIQEFMRVSRSDVRQQHINEQLSAGEAGGPVVHTSAFNKLHSSQSYHQSSSKHTEIQTLQAKLRERQVRIQELEDAIMDHLQPHVVAERQSQGQRLLKQKYDQVINNIKILLNQSKKQCEMLRRELIKTNEMSLSRINDQDRNSITLSDRTTKNRISQTRLIQRRSPKNNAFDTAKAKIQLQMALERLFFPLLQFAEKIITHQELTIIDAVVHCIRELILESKERDYKIYEDTINHEDVMRRLRALGIELS